jgi:hypothetical protein
MQILLDKLGKYGKNAMLPLTEETIYAEGVKFIKNIFRDGEDLYKTGIDYQTVVHIEGYKTKNDLSCLLTEMGLAITRDGKI